MQERVTAAKLLQGHIANLLPDVLNTIEPFLEAANRENLEGQLGPWLANEVAEEVGQMVDSRHLLEEIVREILVDRAARYLKLADLNKELSLDFMPEEELQEEAEENDYEIELEEEQVKQTGGGDNKESNR